MGSGLVARSCVWQDVKFKEELSTLQVEMKGNKENIEIRDFVGLEKPSLSRAQTARDGIFKGFA